MDLSDEDFQRFQNQLIELREKNYRLEQQVTKINAENTQLKTQIENIEKDAINLRLPARLPRIFRRTAGRDIEEIQRENEALAQKVHSQEEDFKLQNETMNRELNEVN